MRSHALANHRLFTSTPPVCRKALVIAIEAFPTGAADSRCKAAREMNDVAPELNDVAREMNDVPPEMNDVPPELNDVPRKMNDVAPEMNDVARGS